MKWAPLGVALLFIAVASVWLGSDRELALHAYARGSSLSTAPGGLSLAHDWLVSRGVRVSLLERALDPALLPANAVVFRVAAAPMIHLAVREEMLIPLHRDRDGGTDAGWEDAGLDSGERSASDAGNPADAGDADDAGTSSRDAAVARPHYSPFDPFQLSVGDEEFVRGGGVLVVASSGAPIAPMRRDAIDRDDGANSNRDGDDEDDDEEENKSDRNLPGADSPARDDAAASEDSDDASDVDAPGAGGVGTSSPPAISGEKVLPILPGVRVLDLPRNRMLPAKALIDAQPIFEVDGRAAIARRALEKGAVWLVDTAEIFENAHLGEHDHLALFAALAGANRPVLFDESVHGIRDQLGMIELLRSWGFVPAMLLVGAAGALLFWRRSVTVGPPADDWRDTRSEAIDYVDSAASLFERALVPADALLLYRSHIVREISLRLGITAAEAQRRLVLLMPGAWPISEGEQLSPREFQTQLKLFTTALERFRNEHPHQA